MYMKDFKCTSIILFIFTILINFTTEIVSINTMQYNSIGVSFFLMQNCQYGLVFANFTLKLLLGCLPSHFNNFSLISL